MASGLIHTKSDAVFLDRCQVINRWQRPRFSLGHLARLNRLAGLEVVADTLERNENLNRIRDCTEMREIIDALIGRARKFVDGEWRREA